MAWKGSYYYRNRREGAHVVTEYVGNGLQAELQAQLDQLEQEQRQAEREAFQRLVAAETAIDKEIDAAGAQVRDLLTPVMVATGHRQHKRQWRRYRMAQNETEIMVKTQPPAESYLSADELNALIQAINTKHPTKSNGPSLCATCTHCPSWPNSWAMYRNQLRSG